MSDQANDQTVSQEQIQELQKQVDEIVAKPAKEFTQAALQVEDVFPQAKEFLTEKATEALSRKAHNQLILYDNGKCFKCLYFGYQVRKGNEQECIARLASDLNDLAEEDLIHSALVPFGSIELANVSLRAPAKAIFSYPMVPIEHYDEIKARYFHAIIEDGSSPKEMEDLSPDLEAGEFLTEIHIFHQMVQIRGFNLQDYVEGEIQKWLSVLPKGTTVKSQRKCAVMGLYDTYEIKFFNPLLPKVKYVESDYIREVTAVGHKVEQFQLLLGIRYLDAEKQDLYPRPK